MTRAISRRGAILLLAGLLALPGCSRMKIEDFAAARPPLVLEAYFDGPVRGWGIQLDRSGAKTKQFAIEAEGRWHAADRRLDLREVWRFDDGTEEVLDWRIQRQADGGYVGTAPPLTGEAVGTAAGNAFRWQYRRTVDGWEVALDDWFWLQADPRVLVARAEITKLGIRIGELVVFYRREDPRG